MFPGYQPPAGEAHPEQPYGEYKGAVPEDLWAAYDQPIDASADSPEHTGVLTTEQNQNRQQAQHPYPDGAEPVSGSYQDQTVQLPPAQLPPAQLAPVQSAPQYGQQPQAGLINPGWYPDPCGEADFRMWNGSTWLDDVMLGTYQFVSPLPSAQEAQLPLTESTIWSSPSGISALSTHRIWISQTEKRSDITEFPLWAVQRAVARTGTNSHQVEITVGFMGYGGRIAWVLRGIPDAPVVAALINRQAARARRSYYGA